MKIIILIILSILSAFLYRAGGKGKPFNTRYRDIGCSLLTLVALWFLFGFRLSYWWAYFLVFGLSWGALSTYWKKKGTDAQWWNWLLHGLGLSFAILPLISVNGHWLGFYIRTIILTASITIWSELVGNVFWEESGRGFLIISTIPLLLI